MTDKLTEAVDAVLNAINDAGPNPQYHDREWMHLRRYWPTLAEALVNLGAAHKEDPK